MGYNLLLNGVYWGYNPLIRSPLILTSCPGHPSEGKALNLKKRAFYEGPVTGDKKSISIDLFLANTQHGVNDCSNC